MTTISKTKHIDDLHFEHQLWSNEMKFYSDELKIFQKRLEEVAQKNSSEDIRKSVEHFQNQFIIQKEQIDIINHHITIHEQALAKFAKEHPVAIDKHLFFSHGDLKDKTDAFRGIYSDLKKEFYLFVGTWL